MDRKEVQDIIKDEIKRFVNDLLDKEVKRLLQGSNTQTRAELIKIQKDSMEAVYKVLWQKRDFWKSDIK